MEFLRQLIREAVVAAKSFGVQGDRKTNWGRPIDGMYFPREKLLSLVHKIVKRYGYAKMGDSGVKPTYDRVLIAIQNDPSLDSIEVDQFFVGDFVSSLIKGEIKVINGMLANKAISALHSPNTKVGHLHVIIAMVNRYEQQLSMRGSGEVEAGEQRIFYKLRLRAATYDGSSLPSYRAALGDKAFIPKTGSCKFEDQAGNWFMKRGAPPAIHMRVAVGKGKILSSEPYELRDGDVFRFRGKVSHSYESKATGGIINVIDGVQPI